MSKNIVEQVDNNSIPEFGSESYLKLVINTLEKSGFTSIQQSGEGWRSVGFQAKDKRDQKIFFKVPTKKYSPEDIALQEEETELLRNFETRSKNTNFEGFAPKVIDLPLNLRELSIRGFSYIDGVELNSDTFAKLDLIQQLKIVEDILLFYDFLKSRLYVHDADFQQKNFRINGNSKLIGKVDWDGMRASVSFSNLMKTEGEVVDKMPTQESFTGNTVSIDWKTDVYSIHELFRYFIPTSNSNVFQSEHQILNTPTQSKIPESLKLLIAPTATPIVGDKTEQYLEVHNSLHLYRLIQEKSVITDEFVQNTYQEVDAIINILNSPSLLKENRKIFNKLRWMVSLLKEKGIQIPEKYISLFAEKNVDHHIALAYLNNNNIDEFRQSAYTSYRGNGNLITYLTYQYSKSENPNIHELTSSLSILRSMPNIQSVDGLALPIAKQLQSINWALKIVARFNRMDLKERREDIITLQEELSPELFAYFDIKYSLTNKLKTLRSEIEEKEFSFQQRRIEILNRRIDQFANIVLIEKDEAWDVGYNWDTDKTNQKSLSLALRYGINDQPLTADDYLELIKKIEYRELSRVDRITMRLLEALSQTSVNKVDQFQLALDFYDLLNKPLIYRPTITEQPGPTSLKNLIKLMNKANYKFELPQEVRDIFNEAIQDIIEELNSFRRTGNGSMGDLKIELDEFS